MQGLKEMWLIGIDEAGRGAVAGPVSVGFVAIKKTAIEKLGAKIAQDFDSKKLSPKKREELYLWITKELSSENFYYDCALIGSGTIENCGIVHATKLGISRMLRRFNVPQEYCEVKLDRGLSAPKKYENQNAYTKGDSLYPAIGLASIVAKVRRDRYMVTISKKYPQYGFEIHKGYGTKLHRDMIKKHRLCGIHRSSWCSRFV